MIAPVPMAPKRPRHHHRLLSMVPQHRLVNLRSQSLQARGDEPESIAPTTWVTMTDRLTPSTRSSTETTTNNHNTNSTSNISNNTTPPTLSRRIEPPPCIPLLLRRWVLRVAPTVAPGCTTRKIPVSAKSASEPPGNPPGMNRSAGNSRRSAMPTSAMFPHPSL